MWSRSSVRRPSPLKRAVSPFLQELVINMSFYSGRHCHLLFFFSIFLYFLSGTDSGFVLFSTLKAVAKKERIIMSPLGVSPGVVWAKVLDVEILSISSVFASYISLGYCIEIYFLKVELHIFWKVGLCYLFMYVQNGRGTYQGTC